MLFCIIYVDSTIVNESKYLEGFTYAIIFYIWFVLTTKTNVYITLLILAILLIVYILQLRINTILNTVELENEKQKINNLKISQTILITVALIITFFGNILYYRDKRIEYTDNWNTLKFIFGNNVCKNNGIMKQWNNEIMK